MLDKFKAKLRSMCRVTRGDECHWIPAKARIVRVPGTKEIVSLRRAIYASFVGPLFGGEDVVATCEVSGCLRPEHLATEPCSGATSKALDLSGVGKAKKLAALFVVGQSVGTHAEVAAIKRLLSQGLGVGEVAAMLGIPVGRVVAANNRVGRTAVGA
jgi:hypothetical protein